MLILNIQNLYYINKYLREFFYYIIIKGINIMFKKQIKIGGQNQLSGKDRKNLKNQMLKQMKEQEVQHFFAKNQKILCEKVSGQKVLIYVNEQYPAFVDGTGKGDYFPTLYLLNAYPDMMKSLILNEGVQTYIFNGANLMWPGVNDYNQLGQFNKDQVVAIRNSKGEFVAVAAMAISKKQLNEQTKKGIACYILHYLNDKLWEHGPKTLPTILIPKKIKKIQQKKVEEKIPQEEKKIEEKKDKKEKLEEKKIEEKKPEKVQKQDKKKKEQEQKRIQEKKPEKVQKQDKKKKEQEQINPVQTKSKNTGKDQTDLQKQEIKPQVKGQKKGNKKNEPVEQIKIVQVKNQKKAPPPKQITPQQSQQEDLSSLLHTKLEHKANKPVVKVVQPTKKQKQNIFSDDDDDKKKKKPKKAPQAPQQQAQQQPPAKKKKQQSQEQQEEQQKGNKKKNKNKNQNQKKKEQSDQEQRQKQTKNKKKKKKKYDSDQEEEIKQTKEEVPEQKSSIAPQIMDQYFKQCFLNALKLGIQDDDLPVDYGYFYTQYIQLARRQGVVLDIKSSNYKKINKFYQLMQKQGFIETKQGKNKNGSVGPTIVKINRDNQELKNFQPTIKAMNKRQIHQQEQIDPKLKFKMSTSVQVVQVLKLKPLILPLFSNKQGEQIKQKGSIYTVQQIKQHINKYLTQLQNSNVSGDKEKQKKKQKKQKNQKYIFVNYTNNPILKQLFKQQIEEYQEQLAKEHQNEIVQQEEQKKQEKNPKKKKQRQTRDKNILKLNKEDIQKKIMQHTQNYYQLRDKQNQLFEVKQGKFKGIQITAQKSNNKNVTKIVGLETFIVPHKKIDQQIVTLVHNLQQKFACSVSTLNLPGKNGGKEITVHGNFLEQLVQMFSEEFKIKKQYITTANKLDKKKQKRFN